MDRKMNDDLTKIVFLIVYYAIPFLVITSRI
ncbi:hypothetical protein HBHAL_4234 [Halobacillus halophilus DSM 2266]|uniref:Uncharacterized protein n=1 Tax=Halobacillus halophilus (strain ATCC 35676 / DSM 2266 / JCM 20832 / KCTC 3685 / LMG 17431 / NBRC 102448 / NCIMB 2269) TaxID=866895 RepID=I0JR06_HALH3|nr:hypothetical protein HBHAL_4234 [Halobacillus halophilus DSM 2266]